MTAIGRILSAKVFVGAEERYWAEAGEELRFEIRVQNVGDETGIFFTQVREARTGQEITPFTVWGTGPLKQFSLGTSEKLELEVM